MALGFYDIDYNPNVEHPSGVSPTGLYLADFSDFSENGLKSPLSMSSADATFEKIGSINENHEFKENKGFIKIEILPETGDIKSSAVGEKGQKSFTNTFAFTLAGTSAENIGFTRFIKNRKLISLIQQKDGSIRQLGSSISPAYLQENEGMSGVKPGELNGLTFTISDDQNYHAPVYKGTITKIQKNEKKGEIKKK